MLLLFCQWLQSTAFFTALRGSEFVYPTVLSLHMVVIALFGGMILLTDLRLLGIVMRKRKVADVVQRFRRVKWAGFALIVTCGVLLFGSKAEEYYYNAFFRTKLILISLMLLHGLIFRRSVYRNLAELDRLPAMTVDAKLAASLSLLLWLCLIVAGRGIGYIEPPFDKIHAQLRPAEDVVRISWR